MTLTAGPTPVSSALASDFAESAHRSLRRTGEPEPEEEDPI